MIIERLSREHRNIEMLLAILERELEIFDRGGRPAPYALNRPLPFRHEALASLRLSVNSVSPLTSDPSSGDRHAPSRRLRHSPSCHRS